MGITDIDPIQLPTPPEERIQIGRHILQCVLPIVTYIIGNKTEILGLHESNSYSTLLSYPLIALAGSLTITNFKNPSALKTLATPALSFVAGVLNTDPVSIANLQHIGVSSVVGVFEGLGNHRLTKTTTGLVKGALELLLKSYKASDREN